MSQASPNLQTALTTLFQLERELRQATNPTELFYVLVNRLRSLSAFDTAIVFSVDGKHARCEMVSDVAVLDRNAPFIAWAQTVGSTCAQQEDAATPHLLDLNTIDGALTQDMQEWAHPHNVWFALKTANGRMIGALWLMRTIPFAENELALLEKLCDVAGHAWQALTPKSVWSWRRLKDKKMIMAVTALLVLVQFIPVSQSVLAPAEVIARDPVLVSAPMNGVLKEVLVHPNAPVSEDQPLLRYDATELQGRLDIAEEELLVAQSELLSAQQGAFVDARIKGELAILQSRMNLRMAERDYARKQMDKVEIRAQRSGIAVFRDMADLEGVPVKTGERLMQIADARDTQLRIEVPVGDAVYFESGAQVRLFLDKSPLEPLDARVLRSSYEATPTPSGVLSYRLVASFNGVDKPRLGLRGTAKIMGEDVPLFVYIFRRPLAKMRQYFGL
jgi:multidrug resistance efflux pump